MEKLFYIDIIKLIKKNIASSCWIVKINYDLFKFLLKFYAIFSRNPPFTVSQLEALVIPEEFEIADWPKKTGVTPTNFEEAIKHTFQESPYRNVKVRF